MVLELYFSSSTHDKNDKRDYLAQSIAKEANTTLENAFPLLISTLGRYIALHKELFGDYTGYLMPQPDVETLNRTRGTFLEFLKREDLLAMKPMLLETNTAQGYGYMDEVAALHGLMWNNPKFMASILDGIKQNGFRNVIVMKHGYEIVWQTIIRKEGFEVIYNADIESMRRNSSGWDLVWQNSFNFDVSTVNCDFVVWTPEMVELQKALGGEATQDEHDLLFNSGLKHEILTASLISVMNEMRNGPYEMFPENLERKIPGGVTGSLDMEAYLKSDVDTDEGIEAYNRNNSRRTMKSVLQQTRALPVEEEGEFVVTEDDFKQQIVHHFKNGLNASDVDVLRTISWRYWPRWSPKEMQSGMPWHVFASQGHNKIWYAGASVSHESVRGVMEYNKLLIRQMKPNN